MFGYLRLPRERLDAEQRELYQGHFCAVCHGLDAWGGKLASLLTNYDMTFWLLVLSALDEPAAVQSRPCTALPWRKVPVLELPPRTRKLVAALALALVGAKVEDDRADGDRPWIRWAFWPLRGSWSRATPWLREAGFPAEIFHDLPVWQARVERERAPLRDLCAPTQHTLAALFGYLAEHCRRPEHRPALEELGSALGLWIYLYDAWTDRDKDARRGSFNAVLVHATPPEELGARLLHALDHVSRALSELPLGERRPLLEEQIGRLRRLTRDQVGLKSAVLRGLAPICWITGGALAAGALARRGCRPGAPPDGDLTVQDCDCDCGGCDGCDCGGCDGCDCGDCFKCGCDCGDCCKCCHTPDCDCSGCECGDDACECLTCDGWCGNRSHTHWDCCWYSSTPSASDTQASAQRRSGSETVIDEDPTMPGARQHPGRWPWKKAFAKKTAPPPEEPAEEEPSEEPGETS